MSVITTNIDGEEVPTQHLEEAFPRYDNSQDNWLNYTKEELAAKDKHLKEMARDFPNLPEAWLEMVYDFGKQKGEEELAQIIQSGEFEKPSNKGRDFGGVIKGAISVVDRDDLEGNTENI
jgi:hypothetical protein